MAFPNWYSEPFLSPLRRPTSQAPGRSIGEGQQRDGSRGSKGAHVDRFLRRWWSQSKHSAGSSSESASPKSESKYVLNVGELSCSVDGSKVQRRGSEFLRRGEARPVADALLSGQSANATRPELQANYLTKLPSSSKPTQEPRLHRSPL
jgi:hypothetical protein